MQVSYRASRDVVEIVPSCLGNHRSHFSKAFKDAWLRENVANVIFVRDNQFLWREVGTLRGLHSQLEPFAPGKLIRVLAGAIFDVAVDIRTRSPSCGQWVGAELSGEKGNQLWVPAGFAHSFATLVPDTLIHDKITTPYSAANDCGLRWDDPDIGIARLLGTVEPVLSDQDKVQPFLKGLLLSLAYSAPSHQE